VNLNGVLSHEIGDILVMRNIPFMFITGYNEPPVGLHKGVDVLRKPFQLSELMNAIESLLTRT
jgi:CheY-like chemotaxis protein